MTAVVTISAAFGAGGSAIGPAVAEHLGVPFVDRAIPYTVAADIGCSLEEALAHDDRTEHGLGRILADAARLPNVTLGGMDVHLPQRGVVPEEEFVRHTEQVIREVADRGEGAVILGRAAQVVLAGHPGTLHVRLDGPRKRRIARVRETMELSAQEAEHLLTENDRARTAYVKHFYRTDPADPGLYHLVIDSTRLAAAACVDMVVRAAHAIS
ncbi:cytidylate kinase-like family protein [Actinoallomurus soli]|uniref:cytidylate kinase-like family protein n=1 Tax=Actinoallomurus soli TaxID=2952535 RepID=UPI002093F25E|nr:cytidylate kinase-like family protein [Actinoallomurus soli]MCO5971531.1 cytidylate kinase-like family protein [Actinoallomurus soli]